MRRGLQSLMAVAVIGLLTAPALADRIPIHLPACGDFELLDTAASIFPPSGYDADPGCDVGTAPLPGCGGEDLVIGDQETWEAFWAQHRPWVTRPEVNFNERLVVAIFTGWRRTGGYGPVVTCVRYYESSILPGAITRVRVEVDDISPGSSCNVTQAFSNPYSIGTVIRPPTLIQQPPPVNFVHESVVTQCSDGGTGECEYGICGTAGGGGPGGFGIYVCCPQP